MRTPISATPSSAPIASAASRSSTSHRSSSTTPWTRTRSPSPVLTGLYAHATVRRVAMFRPLRRRRRCRNRAWCPPGCPFGIFRGPLHQGPRRHFAVGPFRVIPPFLTVPARDRPRRAEYVQFLRYLHFYLPQQLWNRILRLAPSPERPGSPRKPPPPSGTAAGAYFCSLSPSPTSGPLLPNAVPPSGIISRQTEAASNRVKTKCSLEIIDLSPVILDYPWTRTRSPSRPRMLAGKGTPRRALS